MSEFLGSEDDVDLQALKLLELDQFFDDESFTPPGAIGLGLPPEDEGPELSGDREPRLPRSPSAAGALVLSLC